MINETPQHDCEYDLIVWGASGFTGRLVVEYLAKRYPPADTFRWAVGGRDRSKLEDMLGKVAFPNARPDIVAGNATDRQSMLELAARTRVVLTTVGPYAVFGTPLVAACAELGTDYVDLCGEVQWMRRVIDDYQEIAERSGARIVMSCGFDSIPSDFGVYCLQREAIRRTGAPCPRMALLVRAMRGGTSGGTFASMLNALDEARRDRQAAAVLADPYALNPAGERSGPDARDQRSARYEDLTGSWTAPFVMASINTRVVRRSNALEGYPYARDFRYAESTLTGPGFAGRVKATLMSWGLGLFVVAAAIPLTRRLIVRQMIPKPGEGPSREKRENGFFKLQMAGRLAEGGVALLTITGDRDPGYGSTSKMLAESAVCLVEREPTVGGGCWTPASAMGDHLLTRLETNAGLAFRMD